MVVVLTELVIQFKLVTLVVLAAVVALMAQELHTAAQEHLVKVTQAVATLDAIQPLIQLAAVAEQVP